MNQGLGAERGAALVTGAGVRLGRELALAAATLGYGVAVHYNRSREPAEETVRLIEAAGGRADLVQADFSHEGFDADTLLSRAQAKLGSLTLLVNSASVYAAGTIAQTSRALISEQWRVNLQAPFLLTGAFARLSAGREGQVINILDNKIAFHQNQYAAYLLSKKALADFTVMAALEFAPQLRVNAIAPGVVLPASERSAEYLEWRRQGIPVARRGGPEHIARALAYLVENDFVTGQILFVDGGESVTHTGRNSESYSGD